MAPTFLKSTFPQKPISHSPTPWSRLGSVPLRGRGFRLPCPSPIAGLRGDGCSLRLGFEKLRVDVVRRGAAVDSGGNGSYGGLGGGGGSSGGGGGGEEEEDRAKHVSFLSWYMKVLDEHTVLTKSVTSGFLNLVGDLICQILVNQVEVLDIRRLSVITFLGFMLVGPTLHFWYYSLSKLVSLPGTGGTVLRLFLDQFLFSPTFIGVFLSSLVTLEGKPSLVIPKLQQEWLPAVVANWQLWIPFQFLNFQFVPQNLQVLAANVVALAWNVILSFMAHRDVAKK